MADFDIFNLSVSNVETHKQTTSSTEDVIYKPSADDGKDGTYKALIRFVPNPENPRKSLVRKYVHWLTDAASSGVKAVVVNLERILYLKQHIKRKERRKYVPNLRILMVISTINWMFWRPLWKG